MKVNFGKVLVRLGDVDDTLGKTNCTDCHGPESAGHNTSEKRDEEHDEALVSITKVELVYAQSTQEDSEYAGSRLVLARGLTDLGRGWWFMFGSVHGNKPYALGEEVRQDGMSKCLINSSISRISKEGGKSRKLGPLSQNRNLPQSRNFLFMGNEKSCTDCEAGIFEGTTMAKLMQDLFNSNILNWLRSGFPVMKTLLKPVAPLC